MKFNVNETIKKAEDEGLISKGSIFKPKEGANRIRLLSPCLPYQSTFTDKVTGETKTSTKFVCFILDRADGEIKLYFMPQTVLDLIGGLQMSEDFGFDEVPMPYDITINAVGAGKKEVKYSVVGARQNTELTTEEMNAFLAKDSIDKVLENLQKGQGATDDSTQQAPKQPNSGYEKAKAVADTLPGGTPATAGQITPDSEPSSEDINVEDIPF